MNKVIYLFLSITIGFSLGFAQSQFWEIDPAHTSVQFEVQHMVISEVTGLFHEFSGTITTSAEDYKNAKIDGIVKINSIDTGNERRDSHLRSEDFFYSEKYPEMSFTSKSVKKTKENTYLITGNLTIRGITKMVTFTGIYNGTITAYGKNRMGWHAFAIINRFDFGLNWNKVMETGNLVVGEMVKININAEFVQQN